MLNVPMGQARGGPRSGHWIQQNEDTGDLDKNGFRKDGLTRADSKENGRRGFGDDKYRLLSEVFSCKEESTGPTVGKRERCQERVYLDRRNAEWSNWKMKRWMVRERRETLEQCPRAASRAWMAYADERVGLGQARKVHP